MKKDKLLNLIIPVISCACIILLWAVSSAIIDSEYILPSVGSVLKDAVFLFCDGGFYLALLSTLLRSLIAFFCSFSIAFLLAFLSYRSRNFSRAVSPIISVTRALPTIAVVLLLLFWTNSFIAPVIVTMLVVLPTLYNHVFGALGQIDRETVTACKVFGVSGKDVFFKVKLPAVLPDIIRSIGSGISLNLKLMVAAEVLSQTANSIGYLLNTAKVYFEISQMIAVVLITVIIGVAIEFIFNRVSEKVGAWK